MEEGSRFPNRKRKNVDEPVLGEKLPDAELQAFHSESRKVEPLPVSGYHVREAALDPYSGPPSAVKPQPPPSESAAAAESGLIDVNAAAEEQTRASHPPIFQPDARVGLPEASQKPAGSSARLYIFAGVLLGVLLVIGVVVGSYLMSPPTGRYDMGPVTSSATGMEGHLFIQWDKKLQYRLALKPGDPDQQAAFALAVAHPPRPLSITIQLLNVEGFVLCSKEILLKYNPREAAPLAGSSPQSEAGSLDMAKAPAQSVDFAGADALEAAQEKGKDLFQNQIGPDGQIAAINSQGELPCSAEAYEKTENWSFTPNFPSVDEQNELLDSQQKLEAGAARPAAERPSGHPRRTVAKAPARILPFSIEGDDSIVDFDPSHGIIQTRGRRTFLVDKATAANADPRWQDYPVLIHFRCDQTASCTLVHFGGGVLRAKLGN